ncbi:MAG: adenylate cyclase [Gammaproteobacteria bacterium]
MSDHRTRDGGLVAVYTDISKHKRRERELAELVASIEKSRDEARRPEALFQEAIESISEGFVIYDADEQLVVRNSVYRGFYEGMEQLVVPGARRIDITEAAVKIGLFPSAQGNAERWLDEHLQRVRSIDGVREQRLRGDRWLQISERRTQEGSIVGINNDIMQL